MGSDQQKVEFVLYRLEDPDESGNDLVGLAVVGEPFLGSDGRKLVRTYQLDDLYSAELDHEWLIKNSRQLHVGDAPWWEHSLDFKSRAKLG